MDIPGTPFQPHLQLLWLLETRIREFTEVKLDYKLMIEL